MLLFVAGAVFGEVQVSLFVAGAVFGEVQPRGSNVAQSTTVSTYESCLQTQLS